MEAVAAIAKAGCDHHLACARKQAALPAHILDISSQGSGASVRTQAGSDLQVRIG